MASLLSLVGSALGGIWLYLAVGAACLGVGAYGGYRFELSAVDALKLADEQAAFKAEQAVAALQKKADAVTLAAAVAEATSQNGIVTRTITITKEVPVHVSDSSHCITFGLVRVLDAAAAGTNLPPVPEPPAQPDDACAPVSWRDFAGDIISDYGTGHANAEQLTQLQNWIRSEQLTAPGKP